MRKIKDITGLRSHKLVAMRFSGEFTNSRNALWLCECDCGGTRLATASELARGKAKSCGCFLKTQFDCKEDGCDGKAVSRHLCNKHLHRKRRAAKGIEQKTSMDIHERFQMKTREAADGCIEWTGTCDEFGYGQTSWKGVKYNTHRLSWILAYGEIENGLYVCHSCDNPACMNLGHLFLGTQKDNIHDAISKGRMPWQQSRSGS